MIEEISAYEDSLSRVFSVPRSLSDHTPVTGPSPEERVLMMEFIADTVRQRGQPGFLGCYELGNDANAYVTYMLCLLPLIATMAKERGQSLVWAATSSTMKARASLHMVSLFVTTPIQMVDWGDLAELARTPNPALAKIFVIGDVDFEQDNTRQQLSSCDGIVGHDETLRLINRWARDKHQNMILFHRKGWAAALDVKALKNIERKSACFIATACCESAEHPAVQTLRRFRDERLTRHRPGRGFIRFYEQVSPPVADLIRTRAWARRLVSHCLVQPLSRWAARRLG